MRALEFIKSLHEAQGGREAFNQFLVSNSGPEQFAPFTQNKIAMSVEDDWVLFRVMRYGSDMELGIAPIPTPDGKQAISVSTTNTMYMIPHNARHPNEAWAFIRFLNSPEGKLAYADAVSAYGRSRGQQDSYTGFRPSRKAQAWSCWLINPISRLWVSPLHPH